MIKLFIVGSGRCGTTLLGSLLGGSDGCLTTPEGSFKINLLNFCDEKGNIQPDYGFKDVFEFLEADYRFLNWEIKPDWGAFLENGYHSYNGLLEWVVKTYGAKHEHLDPHIWIDHHPGSISHCHPLSQLLNNCLFIHMIRDGRDVALSLFQTDWGPNTIFYGARYWRNKIQMGKEVEKLLPNQTIKVFYEDLIKSPELTLKRICDFVGITYHASILSNRGLQLPEYTKSQHQQVNQSFQSSKLQKWKREMSKRQNEMFESLAGDELKDLGYETRHASPNYLSPLERFCSRKYEHAKKAINAKRKAKRIKFAKNKALKKMGNE